MTPLHVAASSGYFVVPSVGKWRHTEQFARDKYEHIHDMNTVLLTAVQPNIIKCVVNNRILRQAYYRAFKDILQCRNVVVNFEKFYKAVNVVIHDPYTPTAIAHKLLTMGILLDIVGHVTFNGLTFEKAREKILRIYDTNMFACLICYKKKISLQKTPRRYF